MIGIEAGEHLVGARDHLLAGDVGAAVATVGAVRARAALGDRDAGDGEQRSA
jgi:hypothetical protein